MSLSIGGVTLDLDEEPSSGTLPFARKQQWLSQSAISLIGRIQQLLGTDGYVFRLRFNLKATHFASLKTLYDLQASGGGPYEFIWALAEPYTTGFNVVITEFDPELDPSVNPGLGFYATWIGFEEVVS